MNITSTKYVASYPDVKQCPDSLLPEYAFIGRSNVGKSSLINMLTGHSKLAKTSGNPGKTQKINYFLINESWYLVDLPGYGYAKVSKTERHKWRKMVESYLLKREQLLYVFQLIDARIPPQDIDFEFMEWMGMSQIPFVIANTKNDKPKKNKQHIAAFEARFLEKWERLPVHFTTSAKTKEGQTPILQFIDQCNREYSV